MKRWNDPPMKASRMRWHLARRDNLKLALFCEKNNINVECRTHTAPAGQQDAFQLTYTFDNGGFITAEAWHGNDQRGFSLADHFKVLAYEFGN